MEISKADWKLYRERVSDWQEHYMDNLTKSMSTYLHPREMLLIFLGVAKEN